MAIVPDKRFTPLPESEKLKYGAIRPSLSYWQDAGRRFRKNKLAMISAAVLVVILLAAIFVPLFYRYTYSHQDLKELNNSPNARAYLRHRRPRAGLVYPRDLRRKDIACDRHCRQHHQPDDRRAVWRYLRLFRRQGRQRHDEDRRPALQRAAAAVRYTAAGDAGNSRWRKRSATLKAYFTVYVPSARSFS